MRTSIDFPAHFSILQQLPERPKFRFSHKMPFCNSRDDRDNTHVVQILGRKLWIPGRVEDLASAPHVAV
jgi:hypothetical protein